MSKIKPTISQIIFSLTFIYSLTFLRNNFIDFLLVYSFFLWIWLSFIAKKSTNHNLTNYYGSTLTNTNIILTLLLLFLDFIIMLLSASFLARMIFGMTNVYFVVMYGTIIAFIISVLGHLYVTTRNLLKIDPSQTVVLTLIKLIFYPFGIWTTQEILKNKEKTTANKL